MQIAVPGELVFANPVHPRQIIVLQTQMGLQALPRLFIGIRVFDPDGGFNVRQSTAQRNQQRNAFQHRPAVGVASPHAREVLPDDVSHGQPRRQLPEARVDTGVASSVEEQVLDGLWIGLQQGPEL